MTTGGDWRPLLAGVARAEADAVVIATATRDVRVAGEAGLTAAVLSRCDGRTPAAEIAAGCAPQDRDAALELLGSLREHGALVDCTEAWRVLEEQASAGSSFYPAPGADELAELTERRWRPQTAGPAEPLDPAESAVASIAGRRASAEPGDPARPLTFPELSAILVAAYGAPGDGRHAAVASGGALYPLALHVLVRRPVGPLAPGIWWFDRDAGTLALVAGGPPPVESLLLPHELSDALLAREQPVLVISADIARGSGKYGNRAHRYALLEAGSALQGAALAAAELGVPLRAIGGFDESRTALLLGLGDLQPLLAVLAGS